MLCPAAAGYAGDMARVERAADAGSNYAELGYALLGRVLSDQQVRALRAEEERFRPPLGYGRRDNKTLRVALQLCHKSQPVRDVATRGPHIADVVRLLGPDVCLTHVQFVTKLADDEETTSEIPWHQDSGYGALEPPEDLTVFFALTDMDEQNGCLHVVPRTHRQGLQEHSQADVNPLLRAVEAGGEPREK